MLLQWLKITDIHYTMKSNSNDLTATSQSSCVQVVGTCWSVGCTHKKATVQDLGHKMKCHASLRRRKHDRHILSCFMVTLKLTLGCRNLNPIWADLELRASRLMLSMEFKIHQWSKDSMKLSQSLACSSVIMIPKLKIQTWQGVVERRKRCKLMKQQIY